MAKPKPVPSVWVTVVVRSLSNSWYCTFWNSSLMPIPVSLTWMRYTACSACVSSCSIHIATLPPAGVNFCALAIKFTQIVCMCWLSASTRRFFTVQRTLKSNCLFSIDCLKSISRSRANCCKSTFSSRGRKVPLSIREIFKISLINFNNKSPAKPILCRQSWICSRLLLPLAISVKPKIAFIGVRISWLMLNKNLVLASLATLALAKAASSCCLCSCSLILPVANCQ